MGGTVGKLWKDSGVGLPYQPYFFQELRHSVWEIDDGVGGNLPGPPVKIRPVPVLSGGHAVRVAGDTPTYSGLCQAWPPLGTLPPPKNPKMYCMYLPKESSSL